MCRAQVTARLALNDGNWLLSAYMVSASISAGTPSSGGSISGCRGWLNGSNYAVGAAVNTAVHSPVNRRNQATQSAIARRNPPKSSLPNGGETGREFLRASPDCGQAQRRREGQMGVRKKKHDRIRVYRTNENMAAPPLPVRRNAVLHQSALTSARSDTSPRGRWPNGPLFFRGPGAMICRPSPGCGSPLNH
jgi:hypothetical protein